MREKHAKTRSPFVHDLWQFFPMIYDAPFPGETPLVYEYFCVYRDAGPTRSLRSLVDVPVNGKTRSLRQIGAWSSEHAWVERTEAFDADVAAAAAAETHQKRVDMHAEFTSTDLEIARQIQADFHAFLAETEKPLDAYLDWIEIYESVRAWMYAITIETEQKPAFNTDANILKALLGG